jgi:hypothetical protein
MKCELCEDRGWIIAFGRLGDEIQKCQDCFKFESDKQAYDQASNWIDVSDYLYDDY